MGVYDNLNQFQFGTPVAPPSVESAPTMPVQTSADLDMGWADRDMDPVLATNTPPVAPVRSAGQTMSTALSVGYKT